jgi:hypothetical protein
MFKHFYKLWLMEKIKYLNIKCFAAVIKTSIKIMGMFQKILFFKRLCEIFALKKSQFE